MANVDFGPIPWQAAEIIGGLLATELQSDRVTDTQGYSVYGWVKFFVPDFNKLPYLLRSQGDNNEINKLASHLAVHHNYALAGDPNFGKKQKNLSNIE